MMGAVGFRAGAALAALALVLTPGGAAAQGFEPWDTQGLQAVGWHGFQDFHFILQSVSALALALGLGALIAYHPMTPRTVDTLEEAELPRVHLMYAVVGAMIGVTVLEYGMVVGFVVFGLGGLLRFRTNTDSTRDTVRLIIVTLLGLICGLNLPHFAVIAAAFAFVLIYMFDSHPICRVVVRDLPDGRLGVAAEAYRTALAGLGCKVLSEKKSPSKHRAEFVFRVPRATSREQIHAALGDRVPAELRGDLDWEVE